MYLIIADIAIASRFVTRAARPVAQKVWQTSGTIATGVTVARGSRDLWKMWQTSGSGRLVTQNRGKLVAVAD